MNKLLNLLREQRWDDHRYYHHSRINQSLHLVSAISFLIGYALLFYAPATAAIVCWLVGMLTRQSGHFFFEPKSYDVVNQATHEHKEEIKVGYNLRRKVVLMAVWAMSPVVLLMSPDFFGLLNQPRDTAAFVENLGLLWLAIGFGGLMFRTIHLFFLKDVATGIVWFVKIITDPFHDVMLYWRSPVHLLRGELYDRNVAVRSRD